MVWVLWRLTAQSPGSCIMQALGCLPGGSEASVNVPGLSHGDLLHLLPMSVLGWSSWRAPFPRAEFALLCLFFPTQIETSHARGAQLGQRPAQGGTSGPSSVPSSPRTDAVSSLPTSALFPSSGSAIFMQKDERVSQRLPPGNLSQLLPGAKRVPLLTAGTAGSSLRRKGLPAACGVRWLPLRARSQHGIV